MIGTGAHLCPLSATEKPQHPCLLSLHRTSESFSTLFLATPNFTVLAVKRERRGCLPNSGSLLCRIPALTSQSCQQLRANDIFDLSGRATPTSDSAVAPRGTRQLILLRVRSSCGTMAAPPQLSQPGEVTWGGQASISRVPGCGDAGCRAEAKWPEERWSDRKMRNRGLRSRRGLHWGWCLLLTVSLCHQAGEGTLSTPCFSKLAMHTPPLAATWRAGSEAAGRGRARDSVFLQLPGGTHAAGASTLQRQQARSPHPLTFKTRIIDPHPNCPISPLASWPPSTQQPGPSPQPRGLPWKTWAR